MALAHDRCRGPPARYRGAASSCRPSGEAQSESEAPRPHDNVETERMIAVCRCGVRETGPDDARVRVRATRLTAPPGRRVAGSSRGGNSPRAARIELLWVVAAAQGDESENAPAHRLGQSNSTLEHPLGTRDPASGRRRRRTSCGPTSSGAQGSADAHEQERRPHFCDLAAPHERPLRPVIRPRTGRILGLLEETGSASSGGVMARHQGGDLPYDRFSEPSSSSKRPFYVDVC